MTQIKLRGTGLERDVKIHAEDKKQIKKYRKQGYTYNEIASIYGVSSTTIRRVLLSKKELRKYDDMQNALKRARWQSFSKEERFEIGKRWRESHEKYVEELLLTKLNNIQ